MLPRTSGTLVVLPLLALVAACSGSDDADDPPPTADESESPEAPGPEEPAVSEDQSDPPDQSTGLPDGWVLLVGGESYDADDDLTICFTLPGDTFVVNGAGTHPTIGDFEFFVGTEAGAEMSFESAATGSFEVIAADGGDIVAEINDRAIGAVGTDPSGQPFTIAGTCR